MENYLRHWGIKGMKWGVRRYQNKDGSLTPAGRKRYNDDDVHDDYKRAHDSKNVKYMSDKELRERNNRLQMEQQYASMTKQKSRGEKVVKAIVATAGTIAALEGAYQTYKRIGTKVANSPAGQKATDAVVSKIGDIIFKPENFAKPLH